MSPLPEGGAGAGWAGGWDTPSRLRNSAGPGVAGWSAARLPPSLQPPIDRYIMHACVDAGASASPHSRPLATPCRQLWVALLLTALAMGAIVWLHERWWWQHRCSTHAASIKGYHAKDGEEGQEGQHVGQLLALPPSLRANLWGSVYQPASTGKLLVWLLPRHSGMNACCSRVQLIKSVVLNRQIAPRSKAARWPKY